MLCSFIDHNVNFANIDDVKQSLLCCKIPSWFWVDKLIPLNQDNDNTYNMMLMSFKTVHIMPISELKVTWSA